MTSAIFAIIKSLVGLRTMAATADPNKGHESAQMHQAADPSEPTSEYASTRVTCVPPTHGFRPTPWLKREETAQAETKLRTVLICQADAPLNAQGIARWLASFTDLAGLVLIHETKRRLWWRVRREVRRTGLLRFCDVLAFRLYYRLMLRRGDKQWEAAKLAELCRAYPPLPDSTQVLHVRSPNRPEVEDFVRRLAPGLMLARCKTLFKERLFSLPTRGTYVMHPGICPEYRNAHGCFWALSRNDIDRVGMTLLRIDEGIDTGPVYGYYRCKFDERVDSHIVIQNKVVVNNLDLLRDKLLEIGRGGAQPIQTHGRDSHEWGQPWLSGYWRWQRQAARRAPGWITLMYHDVVDAGNDCSSGFSDPGAAHYKLTLDVFRAHLNALAKVMPGPPGTVANRATNPTGAQVLLTFDDGGLSAAGPIADLLEERGWRGHFFVPVDFIGKASFLSGEQIRLLHRRGHVIGSHSCSHPMIMARCSWDQLVDEWSRSCAILSEILGEPVTVASIPGGSYSRRVAEAAALAGIRVLFNSEPSTRVRQVNGCLIAGRYTVYAGMTATSVATLVSRPPWRRLRQTLAWKVKKTAKALGGQGYLAIRERLLSTAYGNRKD